MKPANNFSLKACHIRPGTRFDLRGSQFCQTKKRRDNNMFQCNNITLEVSWHYLIKNECMNIGWRSIFTFNLRPVQTLAILLANKTQQCGAQHVASVCTPCCVLLRVVGSCQMKFETGQTSSNTQHGVQTLATCWAQQCCERLHGPLDMIRELMTCTNLQAWAFIFSKVNK